MLKGGLTFFKKVHITRIMCVLAFVFCLTCLSGCSMIEGGSQGDEAVAAEKETMNCWTCSLFELAFRVVNSMSSSIMASVAGSAVGLLAVCFGLWLALYILKYVSSLQEPDVAAFWKGLAVQAFMATLVAALLNDMKAGSASLVFGGFVDPIFSGFVDTGLMIINASGADLPCSPGGTSESGMLCLVAALQEKLNVTVGISYLSIIAGPTIFVIMVGAGIYCVSIFMMVYFPVLLLDCVFRYCILVAMLPLMVVGFCFKATRDFAAQGGKILVEIGLAVVGMCVFTAVTVQVIHKYIDEFIPYVRNPLYFLDDPSQFEQVICGPGITGLIFVILFLKYFADVILELMGLFSGGVGGLGQTAQGTYRGVKGIAKTGVKAAKFGVNRGLRKADKMAKNTKERLEEKQKRGENLSDKEKKQLSAANEHLQDRGHMAKGKDGKMHTTQSYNAIGKSGLRNWAKGVAQDWNSGPLDQSVDRHDHEKSNTAGDGYKGDLVD